MARHVDVVVIGCGAMGSAACWMLARQGVSVLGLERHAIAHAWGSSHGGTRIFREAYFEHADYVPLLRRARVGFEALEEASGEAIFEGCGVLLVGAPDSPIIQQSQAAARQHGIAVERLDAETLSARYPQLAAPEGAPPRTGLWEPGGGFVRPERAIRAMAGGARRHGAEIQEGAVVRRLRERIGEVEIELADGQRIVAGRAIVSGGAWATGLLSPVLARPLPLIPTREVQFWMNPKVAAAAGVDRLPAWLLDYGTPAPLYGIPMDPRALDGEPGSGMTKLAVHGSGAPCDPDTVERAVTPQARSEIVELARQQLPGLPGTLGAASVCLYTNTPDGHFVIDRSPGGRVAFACGFSGHGFKFASVIGEILTDLVLDREPSLPLAFLRADRFSAA
jgi:sarcosine oxidase